jgi:regulator of nucleoside diphosphate kinase
MNTLPVIITDHNVQQIHRLLESSRGSILGDLAAQLLRRLSEATHVHSSRIPPDVVTLYSCVNVEDCATGGMRKLILALPSDLDTEVDRISVLSPLGWQMLGRREGDLVQFRVPGGGLSSARIERVVFQPETANGAGDRRAAVGMSHEDAMHPEYPLERTCFHLYEPHQLTFARHALAILPEDDEIEVEASHQGLILRGETEAALERHVEALLDYFGPQITIGPAKVRYHHGQTLEEPHMGVRVRCSPECFEAVKSDLLSRGASIVSSQVSTASGVVHASAPLAQLIGYGWHLAKLTAGTAQEVMWLSHYAPIDTANPEEARRDAPADREDRDGVGAVALNLQAEDTRSVNRAGAMRSTH